ncbi:DUF2470 domain-containing protein [Acidothermaceae bacterium B102]|nr:DUF2470 domain-containing protein [Acidothermaceae bacterium B102]
MPQPTAAEQARTVLAHARVALLTTYPRLGRSLTTAVAIGDEGGDLVLQLTHDSAAAADLTLRPVASLRIAPPGHPTVVVTGSAHPLRQRDPRQLTTFRLQIKAVRLGEGPGVPVPVSQFLAALPDPLADEAPFVLAHLRAQHGAELAACLRSQGHPDAQWAFASSLDRFGLEVDVLDDGGVTRVRLDFPTPVERLQDLDPGLAVLLRPQGACPDCPDEFPG